MSSPQQKLIKKLDTALSKAIRERDEDKPCIDLCAEWGVRQAGHFRRRGLMATRFDPRNINGQNRSCNFYKSNANDIYRHSLGIDERWGKGTAKKLFELSKKDKRWERKELETLLDALKQGGLKRYEKEYEKLR